LEKAIALDPGFARAYGELSGLYFDQWAKGWSDDPALMDKALAAVEEAVELSPDEPWAHQDLAFIHVFRGEHDAALDHARRTIELDPGFAIGYFTLSVVHAFAGRFEESLAAVERSMELVPEGSPIALFGRGRAQYFLRQYEEAIASLNAFLNRIPTFPAAHEVLAQVYAETGSRRRQSRRSRNCCGSSPATRWRECKRASLTATLRTSSAS
jgi:tetratricopeptide (TPR) repeat protein